MRAREFLYEYATTQADTVVSTLQSIEQSAEQHPEVIKIARDAVAKAKQYAKEVLAKAKNQPQPAPTESVTEAPVALSLDQELSALQQDIAEVEKSIEEICRAMGDACNTVVAKLRTFLEGAYARMTALIEKGKEQGRDEEFSAGQEFLTKYDRIIDEVTAKVTGTLEAFQANQEKQKKLDPQVEVKVAPDQTQIQKAVRGTIGSIFSELAHKAASRAELAAQRELLAEFLQKCVKGVVPLVALVNKGSGNIIDQLKGSKFKSLYDRVIRDLLAAQPAGSGAGAWGPAELGLSVIGSPVNKSGKGDLNIGGNRRIELKASRVATAGGRINTPAVNKGITGKGDYDIAWNQYSQLLGIKTVGGKVNYSIPLKSGRESVKSIKYTTFGPTLINQVINPAIVKNKIDRKTTIDFLTQVAIAPVLADYKKEANKRLNLSAAVNRDGTINASEFLAQYIALLMSFYSEGEEQVEEILVINPTTGNFHVINAKDPKGIQDKISKGQIQTSSTWIDFTDKQSTASPQIGTE